MKTMPITRIGIRKYALTVAVITIEPNNVRMLWVPSIIAFGSPSSTVLKGFKEQSEGLRSCWN